MTLKKTKEQTDYKGWWKTALGLGSCLTNLGFLPHFPIKFQSDQFPFDLKNFKKKTEKVAEKIPKGIYGVGSSFLWSIETVTRNKGRVL